MLQLVLLVCVFLYVDCVCLSVFVFFSLFMLLSKFFRRIKLNILASKLEPCADVSILAAARRVILTGGGGAPIDFFRRRRRQ